MITATLNEYFQKTSWFMPYRQFSYFHPTRIETSAPVDQIQVHDNGDWIGEAKFNGNSCMVFMNGVEMHVYDRHGKRFSKQNVPAHEKDGSFMMLYSETVGEGIPSGKWMVLVGEYMLKSKTDENGDNWNNNYVIFDILAYDGYMLNKSTFLERHEFLKALYGTEPAPGHKADILYRVPVPGVWLVRAHRTGFFELYEKWSSVDMVEGLCLKQANAGLQPLVGESNNSLSQLKFRKPTKNYRY